MTQQSHLSIGTVAIVESYSRWNKMYNVVETTELDSGNDVTLMGELGLWVKKVDGTPQIMTAQLDSVSGRYVVAQKSVDNVTEEDVVLWRWREMHQTDSIHEHAGIAHNRQASNNNAVESRVYSLIGIYGKMSKSGNYSTKVLFFRGVYDSENNLSLETSSTLVPMDARFRNELNIELKANASLIKDSHRSLAEYVGFGTARRWKPEHQRTADTSKAIGKVKMLEAKTVSVKMTVNTNRNGWQFEIAPAKGGALNTLVNKHNLGEINLAELKKQAKAIGATCTKVAKKS